MTAERAACIVCSAGASIAMVLLHAAAATSSYGERRPGRTRRDFAAIVGIGFAYAAGYATWRMSDELRFDDEGRDVAVIGIIASCRSELERGVRFEFDVDSVSTPNIHVPPRVLLGWYNGNVEVQPGERWVCRFD